MFKNRPESETARETPNEKLLRLKGELDELTKELNEIVERVIVRDFKITREGQKSEDSQYRKRSYSIEGGGKTSKST